MIGKRKVYAPEQLAVVRWAAGLGAVTAPALARAQASSLACARTRLAAAERVGLLRSSRVLVGEPTLYAATSAGMRAAGVHGLEPCRISAANAPHAIACAGAAAALARAYPDHTVMGERELRRDEREAGGPLASAELSRSLHRPDLVLWPRDQREPLPVAVEVELTVKGPARLAEICRAWARCRCVAGTLYLASPHAQRPLARAIARAGAEARIVLVGLEALTGPPADAIESTVPGDA